MATASVYVNAFVSWNYGKLLCFVDHRGNKANPFRSSPLGHNKQSEANMTDTSEWSSGRNNEDRTTSDPEDAADDNVDAEYEDVVEEGNRIFDIVDEGNGTLTYDNGEGIVTRRPQPLSQTPAQKPSKKRRALVASEVGAEQEETEGNNNQVRFQPARVA